MAFGTLSLSPEGSSAPARFEHRSPAAFRPMQVRNFAGRAGHRVIARARLAFPGCAAVLREVNVISGLATSILADLQREESLLQQGQVRLKPLVTLPVGVYDQVKAHAPTSLLKQEDAFLDLIRLQAQCAFTNALAAEQQRWKAPDARDQEDQLETLASFHPAIAESVGTVIERSERLRPALRKAGDEVGGLNLHGPPT